MKDMISFNPSSRNVVFSLWNVIDRKNQQSISSGCSCSSCQQPAPYWLLDERHAAREREKAPNRPATLRLLSLSLVLIIIRLEKEIHSIGSRPRCGPWKLVCRPCFPQFQPWKYLSIPWNSLNHYFIQSRLFQLDVFPFCSLSTGLLAVASNETKNEEMLLSSSPLVSRTNCVRLRAAI